MDVQTLLRTLERRTLEGEGGEALSLGLEPPASEARIEDLTRCLGEPLPEQFREYLRVADGMLFFGEEILGTDCLERRYTTVGLLPFHSWGNGDMDCLVLSEGEPAAVVFCHQGTEPRLRVAGSFVEWLQGAFTEVERCGTLRHPVDYGGRCGHHGLYAEVAAELRRRDLIGKAPPGGGGGGNGGGGLPHGGAHGIGGESIVSPLRFRR